MRMLAGCEESGIVRREFEKLGWDAWSCDILPSRDPDNHKHLQCDVLSILNDRWDLAIFFTPCTHLTNSGVKHLYINGRKENGIYQPRWDRMKEDAELFQKCLESDIPHVASENPIPHGYALELMGSRYDQIIQPYMFGHMERKSTCIWLRSLPPLVETDNVYEQMKKLPKREQQRIHYMSPGRNRQRDRSETYFGIAKAFATQYTEYIRKLR